MTNVTKNLLQMQCIRAQIPVDNAEARLWKVCTSPGHNAKSACVPTSTIVTTIPPTKEGPTTVQTELTAETTGPTSTPETTYSSSFISSFLSSKTAPWTSVTDMPYPSASSGDPEKQNDNINVAVNKPGSEPSDRHNTDTGGTVIIAIVSATLLTIVCLGLIIVVVVVVYQKTHPTQRQVPAEAAGAI